MRTHSIRFRSFHLWLFLLELAYIVFLVIGAIVSLILLSPSLLRGDPVEALLMLAAVLIGVVFVVLLSLQHLRERGNSFLARVYLLRGVSPWANILAVAGALQEISLADGRLVKRVYILGIPVRAWEVSLNGVESSLDEELIRRTRGGNIRYFMVTLRDSRGNEYVLGVFSSYVQARALAEDLAILGVRVSDNVRGGLIEPGDARLLPVSAKLELAVERAEEFSRLADTIPCQRSRVELS